ncbi:S-adenosylmethionine:tRNA ribosyltransferase-isomerase, partial [Candidatus Uhrbacteria bacterium]|nr:S-adenosylmethionine:tRNA ribosyltransferase-isomerase [Candidatus Uhrbacteria bacterium]
MKTSLFDYNLPASQIAQKSASPRDASRLMVLDRSTGHLEHRHFRDILNFLKAGDLLVFNNTRVFRARLSGVLPTGGKVEIFLLRPAMSAGRDWIALGRPGRKLKAGVIVKFKGDPTARVVRQLPDGTIK